MATATKLALGLMGWVRPRPAIGDPGRALELPPPVRLGGQPLFEALAQRRSSREFSPTPLELPLLSSLLWAAWGVNRVGGGRTAPSALDAQEIDLYVALPTGAFLYEPHRHRLFRVADQDVRAITGYQDFVDEAPLELIYVADHRRMRLVPADQRVAYSSACAGAIAQNVYLFCASERLATVIRAWINRGALSDALGLEPDQHLLLAQTIGYPKS